MLKIESDCRIELNWNILLQLSYEHVETTCMNKVKKPKTNEQKQLQSPKQSTRKKKF